MGRRLYVGNLAYTVDQQSLEKLFGPCGPVESVNLITDRDTGRSKGFAFVEMGTDSAAQKAIQELNGKDLEGRPLTVNEARPQKKKSGFGGGGGGGGGGRGRW